MSPNDSDDEYDLGYIAEPQFGQKGAYLAVGNILDITQIGSMLSQTMVDSKMDTHTLNYCQHLRFQTISLIIMHQTDGRPKQGGPISLPRQQKQLRYPSQSCVLSLNAQALKDP